MGIFENAEEEFKRSPVTIIAAVCGVIIAFLSLLVAWIQSIKIVDIPLHTNIESSTDIIHIGNLFLVIGYFLASMISAALFIRVLSRKHDLTALFTSIPLVAFINFTTILLIYLAPPKTINKELFMSAHDLILYASVTIFVSFFGKAILSEMASLGRSGESDSQSDGLAILFLPLLLMLLWSSLISAGQHRLSETFLPKITYPSKTIQSEELKKN